MSKLEKRGFKPAIKVVLVCIKSINELTSVSEIEGGSTVSVAAKAVVAINVMAHINRLYRTTLLLCQPSVIDRGALSITIASPVLRTCRFLELNAG